MATVTIFLPVGSPASMTAQLDISGAGHQRLLFDADTAEYGIWQFRVPSNYPASGAALTAKIQYTMASATSGNVDFEVSLMAVTDGDSADVDTASFDTANAGNATVPGTAGYLDEISILCTTVDSVAAGDFVLVKLQRDATDATNDTATGDAEVIALVLQYTYV